jgi:hypothetical protein
MKVTLNIFIYIWNFEVIQSSWNQKEPDIRYLGYFLLKFKWINVFWLSQKSVSIFLVCQLESWEILLLKRRRKSNFQEIQTN